MYSEVPCMPDTKQNPIDLQTLQSIQIRMLKILADICDANGLRYYLASGTLLGAVRHQGPIPWDDDLDIQLPRPDFMKLVDILRSGALPDDLEYSWLDSPSHIVPFLKVFYKDSLVFESKVEDIHRESKIWVDVFSVDGLPSNVKHLERRYAISKQLRNFLYTGIVKPSSLHGMEKLGTMFLKPLSKAIGAHRIAIWLDRFSRRFDFDQAVMIGNLAWGEHVGEALEKNKYLPMVDLKFGEDAFHCPKGYDEHLKNLYGDYMVLPPEDKRRSHLSKYYLIGHGSVPGKNE